MYLFRGLMPSETQILSLLYFCLQMALCSVPSCYLVYSLPIAFISQTSLGLVFLPRDPAVLLLFVNPSLLFLLVLHHIKPLCQLFFRSRWCFSLSLLGCDLSWSHCSQKVPLFSRSQQTTHCLCHSHSSLSVCKDPLSELFSVLSRSFLELSTAVRVAAVDCCPQARPLCSCISLSSLFFPTFGSHPLEKSLLHFPPLHAHTSRKIIVED